MRRTLRRSAEQTWPRHAGSSAFLVKQVSGGIYARAELLYTILPTYSQNVYRRPAWHVPHILAFLAHFVPDRMTLSLQGWHLDETAAQLTLQVTATRTRVRCPLCQT